MSMISSLIESIRGKRAAKYASVGEQYDAAVLAIAEGREVDADSLAEMLDALDRSESDLQADVEAKQRRIAAAAELERLADVAKTIPGMKSELEKLQSELSALIAQRKPKIAELADKVRFAEAEVSAASYHETDLANVGLPLALAQRKAELTKRQTALNKRREEYHDRVDGLINTRAAVSVRITATKQKLETLSAGYEHDRQSKILQEHQQHFERLDDQIKAWDPLKDEIDTETKSLHTEAAAIRTASMKP